MLDTDRIVHAFSSCFSQIRGGGVKGLYFGIVPTGVAARTSIGRLTNRVKYSVDTTEYTNNTAREYRECYR